ncbi:hypothetical protein [Bradyrhizobium sp. 174]|uniref:hypothetical protein n=1 Tax=Bradyrhizobium sp. 174 TaxID=2782645 RepID=UPI001FFC06D9|nr:hypothetical protein [Bradyrhizobium sp. 174]
MTDNSIHSSNLESEVEIRGAVNPSKSELVIDTARPIIDPHHHFWDWRRLAADTPPRYPFKFVLRDKPRYLLDELLTDIEAGHNICATVHLECGSMYRTSGSTEMAPVGEPNLSMALWQWTPAEAMVRVGLAPASSATPISH